MLFQNHQLDEDIKKALVVIFCVNTTIDKGVNKIVDANEENEKIIDVEEFSNEFSDNSFSILLQQIIPKPSKDGKGEPNKTEKLLEKLFDKTYEDNKIVKKIINANSRSYWQH